MMVGNLLIYGAVVTSIGSTAALAWAATRDESVASYGRSLVGITAALLVGAFGFLTFQFVTTDYTNEYVWSHTADYLSTFYRVTGTYAGVNGSLLLWAMLVSVFVAYLCRRVPDREHALVGTIGSVVTTIFAIMAVNRTPFEAIGFDLGRTVFGPIGLNPILLNPYMGIHPPITFAGYALTVPVFAITAAHFIQVLRGEPGLFKRWLPRVMWWLRLSWIMLTAATALGAIWSYNALGWGGLWAWDPVETAVLISWLIVSMAVHAVANYRRRGQNSLLAPGLAAATFPGVIFARLITQSGTSPLHSFGAELSQLLLFLMVASLVLSVIPPLFLWLRTEEGGQDLDDNLLTLGNLLYLSVLVIGVITFISVWGIALPIVGEALGSELSIGVNFFNLWSLPVAVAMLLLLGLYNDYVANGKRCLRMFGAVVAVTLIVGVLPLEGWRIAPDASGLLYGILGKVNALVLFPPVAYVMLGVSDRLMTVIPRLQSRDEKIALTGRGLVHIGLALIILAGPFTYLFATSASAMVPLGAAGMGSVQLEDSNYAASMTDYQHLEQPSVTTYTPGEAEVISRNVESLATSPDQVVGTSQENAIVNGQIADIQSNSPDKFGRLDGVNVWVPLHGSDVELGSQFWVQGPVNTTDGLTQVLASQYFVGPEATDAVTLPKRFDRYSGRITVYKNGNQIADERVGIRNHLAHQPKGYEISINRGLLVDTYIAPKQFDEVRGQPGLYVTVKEVPLMNLVRLGIVVMVLGGFLIFRYDSGDAEDWE